MASYKDRVASFEDKGYYTFSRLTTSDAENPPVLMVRDTPADCTLLVTTEPLGKLAQCTLDISQGGNSIVKQAPPNTVVPFRHTVPSFEKYRVDAAWLPGNPFPPQSAERRAMPPLTEVKL